MRPGSRFSSWSRTPPWRSASPTAATSCRADELCWPAPPPRCSRTRRCSALIWECKKRRCVRRPAGALFVVITESSDGYDVDLRGHKVMQCVVDFAFTLELERMGQRTTVRVEGPFVLSQGDETHELDAGTRPRE